MPPKGKATPAAVDDSFKKVDLAVNDAKTLILALRATEAEVCAKACEALEHFADASDRNKIELVTHGVFEPLVKLLASSVSSLRQLSSLCLCTLVSPLEARLALRKSNIQFMEPLLLLLNADQGAVCHENACLVLDRLCNEYSSRVDVFKGGALPVLLELLGAPGPEVKRAAVRVVAKLLEEYDVRVAIGGIDGLPAVVALLDADYSEVQQSALTCIARAARTSENLTTLVEMGVMEKLVAFVAAKENKMSHVHALTALAAVLQDPGAASRLAAVPPPAKGAEPAPAPLASLIGFISSTEEAVQIAAINCIARAAAPVASRAILLEFKAESALVSKLLSEDAKAPFSPSLVSAAARAISVLAKGRPNAEVVGNLYGVHKLTRLLSHESEDVIAAAVGALAAVIEGVPHNRKILLEAEGVPRLLQLLSDGRADVRASAAACVSSLAQSDFSRPSVRPASVDGLVAALGAEDVQLQQEALRALAVLARDADVREKLLADPTAFRLTTTLLSGADAGAARVAALLVCACADDVGCAQKLCELGALTTLHKLRQTVSPFANAFVDAAYKRLFDSNLSSKFAITGFLDIHDHVPDGFFDAGPLADPPAALQHLCTQPVDSSRPILLVNSLVPRADPAPLLQEPVVEAKGKSGKGKAADKSPHPAAAVETKAAAAWAPPSDPALAALIAQVRSEIVAIDDPAVRASRLAQLVCERMGGPQPVGRLGEGDLPVAELKKTQGSNVLPLGLIRQGSYRPRALLFKALATHADVPCALRRTDYGRAFNIVYTPEPRVVDVMHEPGRLLSVPADGSLALFWEKHTQA